MKKDNQLNQNGKRAMLKVLTCEPLQPTPSGLLYLFYWMVVGTFIQLGCLSSLAQFVFKNWLVINMVYYKYDDGKFLLVFIFVGICQFYQLCLSMVPKELVLGGPPLSQIIILET